MKCPRDGDPLEREIFVGVEIDSCTGCDGTWLDKGEIGKIIGMQQDLMGGMQIKLEPLRDRGVGERLKCPRCENIDLLAYYFSADKKLIVDRCPNCEGVWLDTEELKKAIESYYGEGSMP